MDIKILDEFGLDEDLLQFLKNEVAGFDFDSMQYADEIEVYVSKHVPCDGEKWIPEIDVLVEWTSEDGINGYFGYSTTEKLLREDMEYLS